MISIITDKELATARNKIVCINWWDAFGEQGANISDYTQRAPSSFMIPTTTYGQLINWDKNAIIIASEVSTVDMGDVTVIPRGMLYQLVILTKPLKGGYVKKKDE